MMEQSLMEFKNVSMIFENAKGLFGKKRKVGAVVDVNLKINSGDILAIVGESGCGKTTIGKMINGIYKPTAGEVNFMGKNIWALNRHEFFEYRRSVQMVHQDSYAALNPARTIFQSLSAPILQHKFAKNKVEAKTQLTEFLSLRPKLIVADEPVSMVDVSLRISLLDLMVEMNKQFNIAFIYITHDLATARYIAMHGTIAVMYLGKIAETGNLNKILAAPRHPYLQALLSAVPIPDPRIARAMKPLPLKSLDMPDPAAPPKGCRFNPRCPFAEAVCEEKEPPLVVLGEEMVACHLVERIPVWKWEQETAFAK